MEIRRAELADLGNIMPIIQDAKEYLKEQGIDQWQNGLPDEETILGDITGSEGYLFVEEGEAVGFVVVSFGTDEDYKEIYEGNWITDSSSYAVIHRNAVKAGMRGKGISGEMFRLCEQRAREQGVKSLRIDTHKDNRLMRHLAEKHGFTQCGIIALVRGNAPRVAYEKIL